jgi:serine/threonine-protein kinase RsbW
LEYGNYLGIDRAEGILYDLKKGIPCSSELSASIERGMHRMAVSELSFQLQSKLSELDRVAAMIDRFGEEHKLPAKVVFALNLALDELITNSIKYGYKEDGEHIIAISLTYAPGEVTLLVEDDGNPFNPLDASEPDIQCPVEKRQVGGLGIHLLRSLMDRIDYERRQGKNVVRIIKTF